MLDKKLKALLKSNNLSIAELAKRVNIPKTNIQQWLQGATPNVYQVEKVATYFGLTVDELIFDRKPKSSVEDLFAEALIHTGHYKISITKLTKKDESED
jgi:transcriptional regulator with XRE-family HTH domain